MIEDVSVGILWNWLFYPALLSFFIIVLEMYFTSLLVKFLGHLKLSIVVYNLPNHFDTERSDSHHYKVTNKIYHNAAKCKTALGTNKGYYTGGLRDS